MNMLLQTDYQSGDKGCLHNLVLVCIREDESLSADVVELRFPGGASLVNLFGISSLMRNDSLKLSFRIFDH
jgi:hypothetical protein